jgi:CRP-like cAMP-binding protein
MNFMWDNIFRLKKKDNDIHTLLKENPLFQDMTERELGFIEKIVHIRNYHAGEPVFRQGEVGVGMYIIVKGRIEIFVSETNFAPSLHQSQAGLSSVASSTPEGREIFITQLSTSDFFGELALVEDNGRRSASAIARDEAVLIGFFKPDLLEILSRNPDAGTKIVFRLAEVLGRRLKETTEKVSELRQTLKELNGSKASSDTPA